MAGVTGPNGMSVTYVADVDPATGNIVPKVPTDTLALVTLTGAAAGVNGIDQTNGGFRGVKLVIDVTAITGTTPSLIVTLQGKDAASGKYYNMFVSASLTAVGTTVLTLYPGLTAAANVTANDVLPKVWRVITTVAGTTPAVTATIGASLVN